MTENQTHKMSVEEFNQNLVRKESEISIVDCIKLINDQIYQIDISFIDDFMNMVGSDECCIIQDMLVKYGVLNKIETSATVKRVIDQNVDIPNIEALYNVVQCKTDVLSNKYEYIFHPKLFKIILIRSKNTSTYAQYYLLLEECISHYNDYQILQLQDKIKNICNDRVLKLHNEDKNECFVIIENKTFKDHPYSVIRGQYKNLHKTLIKLNKTEDDIIINIPCCYANNLYNKIKEKLGKYILFQKKYLDINDKGYVEEWSYDDDIEYNHVSITRNIGISGISLKGFIKKIEDIDSERFSF